MPGLCRGLVAGFFKCANEPRRTRDIQATQPTLYRAAPLSHGCAELFERRIHIASGVSVLMEERQSIVDLFLCCHVGGPRFAQKEKPPQPAGVGPSCGS